MELYSKINLPNYRFLPGRNAHPHKSGGHGWGKNLESKEFHQSLYGKENLLRDELFYQAVDLFNNAYYWESHVALEALWNGVKRIGDDGQFFKGFILLNAAGVKGRLEHYPAMQGHLHRSLEIFKLLPIKQGLYKNVSLFECLNFLEKEMPETSRFQKDEMFFPFKIYLEP